MWLEHRSIAAQLSQSQNEHRKAALHLGLFLRDLFNFLYAGNLIEQSVPLWSANSVCVSGICHTDVKESHQKTMVAAISLSYFRNCRAAVCQNVYRPTRNKPFVG